MILLEPFYTYTSNIDSADIGSLLEIPINKKARTAADIKHVLSFEGCFD